MARRAPPPSFLLLPFASLLLLLLAGRVADGRLISSVLDPLRSTPSDLVSNGRWSPQRLWQAETEACEQSYGVLPCTTSAVGNLFLLLVYGYLMFLAATFLSNGSEMLLEILGPGIIGGLFLPILGALPDAILILVSGLSGSKETAQEQVLIGMGLLAGSTVMLLTILWGSCIIVGKCDLAENSTSVDMQDSKRFSLFGSGITTDDQTSYAARIMVISVIPFIVVQLPKAINSSFDGRLTVLIALILSVAFLLSYCLYQIYQPWIQKRRLEYAKLKHVISGILHNAHKQALGRLLTEDGEPNKGVIELLFRKIDNDSNNLLSRAELRALIIGIKFDELELAEDDAVDKLMKEFDTSHDGNVDLEEFTNGISKWLKEAVGSVPSGAYSKRLKDFHQETRQEHEMLIDRNDESSENIDNPSWTYFKALLLLLLGAVIAAVFADPLVDAVDNFSNATHIPSFFISFIAMPFATNSSEAVSAIIFASRKKKRTSSLTFSEIYGAVTMNNTLCLAVFLALVYVRQLTWDFSSEVLIILIVCIIMGLFASFRTTFPLWTSSVAYLLYPLSLVLVYVLDFVFGWT